MSNIINLSPFWFVPFRSCVRNTFLLRIHNYILPYGYVIFIPRSSVHLELIFYMVWNRDLKSDFVSFFKNDNSLNSRPLRSTPSLPAQTTMVSWPHTIWDTWLCPALYSVSVCFPVPVLVPCQANNLRS